MKRISTQILILFIFSFFSIGLKAQVKSGFTIKKDTICSGTAASFTNTSSGGTKPYKFLWDFGDGDTSTNPAPNHVYAKGGTYKVVLYVLDAGFDTNSSHKTISVLASPQPDLGADKRGCWGKGVLLTSGLTDMARTRWFWINGNDTIMNKHFGDSILVQDSGKYLVTVQDSAGCTGTGSVNVFFNPLVQVRSIDTTVCYGDSVYLKPGVFSLNGSSPSVTWIDVIHNNTVSTSPFFKFLAVSATGYGHAADFKVVIMQTSHGLTCVDTGYINVTVNTPTHAILPHLTSKCITDPAFQLPDGDATHSGGSWYYPVRPQAVISNFLYPSVMGETDNNASLGNIHYLYVNQYKCVTNDSAHINISALPSVFAGHDTVICTKNGKYLLNNQFVSPPGGVWLPLTGTPTSAVSYSANHDSVYFDPNASGIIDGTYGAIYSYQSPAVQGHASCVGSDTVHIRVSVKCNLGIDPDLGKSLNLSVFPNPFGDETRIQYTLVKPSKVTVSVFDITGKQLAIILDEQQDAGTHQSMINAEKLKLSQGTYLLKVATENGYISRQIVKF